jgi:hypothetical protein
MAPSDADIAVIVAYMTYFFMQEYLFHTLGHDRSAAFFDDRFDWGRIVCHHGNPSAFKRHLRMSHESFQKLLSYIRPDLEVNLAQSKMWGSNSARDMFVLYTMMARGRLLQ